MRPSHVDKATLLSYTVSVVVEAACFTKNPLGGKADVCWIEFLPKHNDPIRTKHIKAILDFRERLLGVQERGK